MNSVPNKEVSHINLYEAAGSANAAVTHTIAAVSGVWHVIDKISFSYYSTGTPIGSMVVQIDGSNVFSESVRGSAGVSVNRSLDFPAGLYGAKGLAIVIQLAAGGANVLGTLNVTYH